MIKGVKVELGGDEYTIPPLKLGQLEESRPNSWTAWAPSPTWRSSASPFLS